MQLLGHRFLVLSPFLNKPRIWCNVKRRTTQGSSQMQQLLKAGDRNEFKPFFLILWYKRNQNIYLYTAAHSGVILMQIPLHSIKTYLHFSLKRQPMSEWEKSVFKKNYKQIIILDYNRSLDQMVLL